MRLHGDGGSTNQQVSAGAAAASEAQAAVYLPRIRGRDKQGAFVNEWVCGEINVAAAGCWFTLLAGRVRHTIGYHRYFTDPKSWHLFNQICLITSKLRTGNHHKSSNKLVYSLLQKQVWSLWLIYFFRDDSSRLSF